MNTKFEVNGKFIDIKINDMDTARNISSIKSDIFRWLSRIGITSDFVCIENSHYGYEDPFAEIRWVVNGEEFFYRCSSQRNMTNCMAAIEQLVHYEVIFIERGIKSFVQVMNQFRLGYDPSGKKVRSARDIIGVSSDMRDIDYISFVYKKEAKKLHPDMGGPIEAFQELNDAYKELVEELK